AFVDHTQGRGGRAARKEEDSGNNCAQYKKCSRNFSPPHVSAMFPNGLQFARQSWITNVIRVEVGDAHAHSMFHLEGADVVQERSPAFVFRQVLSDMM